MFFGLANHAGRMDCGKVFNRLGGGVSDGNHRFPPRGRIRPLVLADWSSPLPVCALAACVICGGVRRRGSS
jgi:hypothetical protein